MPSTATITDLYPVDSRQQQSLYLADTVRQLEQQAITTLGGDEEVTVELAEGVRVQIIKQMVIDVRGKNQPVAAND